MPASFRTGKFWGTLAPTMRHEPVRRFDGGFSTGGALMNMRTLHFVPVGLIFLMLIASPFESATADRNSPSRKTRALIDASKDGGVWTANQGKATADAMRARGWDVVELPRGEPITSEAFKDFDIVIRPAPFFGYTALEAAAYQEAVSAGARVFIIGSAQYDDAVAEAFSLRFDDHRRLSPIVKIVPHPLTAERENFDAAASNAPPTYRIFPTWSIDRLWTAINKLPRDAVVLAWVGDKPLDENPVFGYSLYNNGYILFSGAALGFGERDPGLCNKVLDFLERKSASDLQQSFIATTLKITAEGPPPPFLLTPENEALLPQPQKEPWKFAWSPIPGARKYQIVVFGSKAAFPLIDTQTSSTSHTYSSSSSSYIAYQNLRGWIWRVRAQGSDGKWGSWSPIQYFDVDTIR
jgi:hypothetical protein